MNITHSLSAQSAAELTKASINVYNIVNCAIRKACSNRSYEVCVRTSLKQDSDECNECLQYYIDLGYRINEEYVNVRYSDTRNLMLRLSWKNPTVLK